MNVLRNSFIARCLASFLLTTFVSQIFFPTVVLALTAGPSQPEVQSFQAASTTDMVNLFSGDFNYNIPLFELPGPNGGYPFNLAYNSGITMDQEASWVGLGWNLNPGALNREMRGLPDDFNGDAITKQVDMRNNFTFGIGGSAHSTLGIEIAGFDPDAGSLGFGIGMSIFYNSYNGVGYSLDPSANFSLTNKNNMTVGIGLDVTLNSQEGVGLNPNVNLGTKSEFVDRNISIGLGYNSNAGMTGMNLNLSRAKRNKYFHVDSKLTNVSLNGKKVFSYNKAGYVPGKWTKNLTYLGASYSFGTSSYTPSMKIPTQSRNVTLSSLVGADPATINLYVGTSGFFNTQYISNKTIVKSGFGYLYMQNDGGQNDLLDYSRSQDGQILKNTPFLPAPSLTQDVYSANAQGLSAMYRPQRSDLGIIYDDQNTSNSAGGSAGPEIGLFTAGELTELHFGGDMSVNYSVTNSGLWRNENNLNNNSASGFQPSNPVSRQNVCYETSYFKVYGEMSSDPISKFDALGGYEAYRVSLDDHTALTTLENDHGSSSQLSNTQIGSFYDPQYPREIRETSIIPFKNSEITNVAGTFNANSLDDMGNQLATGGLTEFTFSYFTNPNSASNNLYKTGGAQFSRAALNGDHIGGFVTTNPNGMKYVYGLPAYNSKKVECQFSVGIPSAPYQRVVDIDKSADGTLINYNTSNTNQTNQYYNKVTTPAYAHSYLLTSVLGADYIDADDVVGPSEGDLGYWVKFSYVKAVSNYKWRSPFAGANYIRGSNTTPVDDISMYMYGEKEIWHLAKAETQSHVAVFYMSARPDGQGAYSELQNTIEALPLKTTPNTSYKLDKISLFTRNDYINAGKPLVSANLNYSNDLCPGVLNNSAGSGKLTLTNLNFTYGDNTRTLSPYVFDYHQSNPAENPTYLEQGTDRWGVYKPYSTATDNQAPTIAQNNPYTSQFDNTGALTLAAFRAQMDNQASVWTLKSIKLPSGGIMDVTYEADDYAYVQNKTATQMMPISGMNTIGNFQFGSTTGVSNLKICFPLETPITATTAAGIQQELQKYIPDNNQIYFKTYSSFSSIGNLNMSDYVSGYADIDTSPGLMGVVETAPPYKTGYITLKPSPAGSSQYHPFALAAWLHVRTEAPYLMNIANMKADPNTDEGNKFKKLASLMSNVEDIRRIFNGFYNECDRKGFGKIIDPSRSFIRLNSPDKIKIGGGLRVKQIVLNDNWSHMTLNSGNEKSSYYGQTYNYTIEENGSVISSGVAANEPQVGGDESPLRYTESYIQKVPALTPNRLLIEHPINDAYYPGESVGYRKVTVKSIASSYSGSNNNYDIPAGILRSGAITYDFYTAKDFPVIEKYTNTVSHPENIPIPIPFIGRTDINKLTMSQGFYIELNDMHGKLKAMTNYGLDKSGNINPQAIEYTKYNYQATPVYDPLGTQSNSISPNNGSGEIVSYILNNKVQVLVSDDGVFNSEPRYMGQDVEFFTDMRETESQSYSGGVNINFEVEIALPVGLSFPDIQPSANINYARCRTTVSNKIVHKSGILTSIENFKDGSKMIATHTLFDPYSGEPLLTQVNNSYEDPVYKYELPAHMVKEYTRMGGKYSTQAVKCNLILTNIGSSAYSYSMPLSQVSNVALFQKGDKVFVTSGTSPRYPAVITAIGTTANSITGSITVLNNATVPNTNNGLYLVEMYDPVYDNTFDENAFAVTSLQDPTANRIDKNCSVNYTYPVAAPCTNGIRISPNSWFLKTIASINNYVKNPLFLTRSKVYSSDGSCVSYFTPFPYIQYVNAGGGFVFSAFSALSSEIADIYFYYANGNAVNFDQVDYLQMPILAGTTAPNIPGVKINSNTLGNYQYDRAPYGELPYFYYSRHITTVHLKNGTTTDAYILYHRSPGLFAQGSIKDLFKNETSKDVDDISDICVAPIQDTYLLLGDIFQTCDTANPLAVGTFNLYYKTLSKVINVSATVFSEFKPLDNNAVASKAIPTTARLQDFDQLVSYLNGSAGTFRPKESWTYLDERSQTTPVTLRTDGTFGDVPFFKHNSPLCKSCPARWKKVVMFTDYFPSGTPQEEQDALGNKSAVLFGYSGAQVTAVAANTCVYEIGFEGFEDYPNISSSNTAPSLQNYYIGKSNLNFYNAFMNRTMDAFANYKIVSANQNMLIIDKPYNTNIQVLAVDVDGQDIATGATISGRYTVQRTQIYPGDASKTIIVLNTPTLNNATPWMGTGKFKLMQSSRALNTSNISSTYSPSINSTYAHTGKSSLVIPGSCTFEQRRLVLTPGKKMVFEAWVKIGSPNPNAGVRFFDNTGQIITASNIDFGLTSITVEGWTKIYGAFVVPTNAESLGICLFGGSGQYAPGASYFDDIRIYPSESNMVSYVYDRLNFRLIAVLDNNNFATYYYYNPSGGLYLTKKETERGIMTLQEVTQSQSKTP